jgi:hypothetical protein
MNKDFIENFNKNKNKDLYRSISIENFKNISKCRICNDVIYYYDSTFTFKNKILNFKGKSYETKKNLDKEYNLSVCEDCLTKQFPEYCFKNKSRVFNQMNYITEFAFGINHQTALNWMKEKYAITESNLIKKWGDEVGKKKWDEYRNKQSISNKFEYKRDKYGWTKNDFDNYNKSRSVTIENLINRHGEEIGLEIWNKYCDQQKYTTSINYFIEKYGKVQGEYKYNDFSKKRLFNKGYSKMSFYLFEYLSNRIDKNYKIYYGENEWYSYDNINKKYYLLDFYIKDLNIGIEFNGDIWHANPDIYESNDITFPFDTNLKVSDIWEKDKIKNDFLKTKLNKLIIIWEKDFKKDGLENTINKILKEIYE